LLNNHFDASHVGCPETGDHKIVTTGGFSTLISNRNNHCRLFIKQKKIHYEQRIETVNLMQDETKLIADTTLK